MTLMAAAVLSIADYGLFALAIVFAELAVLFAYSGFFGFLVVAKTDDASLVSTLFWTILGVGCASGTLMFALAQPLTRGFETDGLAPLLQILACLQPFGAVTAWASARLMREGRMRRYYLLLFQGNIASLVLGLTLLAVWPSIYALIAYRALRVATNLALFLRACPFPKRMGFDTRIFRDAFRFARSLYVARIAEFFSSFGADLLLAYFFSTTESGLFRIASRLAIAGTDLIVLPLRGYATKTFASAARASQDLSEHFSDYLMAGFILNSGTCVVVLAFGESVMSLAFGADYLGAVIVMHLFVVRAVLHWPQLLLEPLLAARHRTSIVMIHNTIWLCISSLAILLFAPFGMSQLAWSQTLIAGAMSITALYVVRRWGGIRLEPTYRKIVTAGLVMSLFGITVFNSRAWLITHLASTELILLTGISACLILSGLTVAVAVKFKLLNPSVFASH